jgi:sugar lactone lactonase YvrE
VPDGACVDSEGFLWNAIYNSNNDNPGVVHRINPHNGLVVYTVHLPDNTSQVTCCCFGGELLDILFITTAAHGKQDEQPHSGALYAAKVPFTGITESRLDFNY